MADLFITQTPKLKCAPNIEVYSLSEAANILNCNSKKTVECVESGDLPGLKIGRSWIFPKVAFAQRLNELALEQSYTRKRLRNSDSTSKNAISVLQKRTPRSGKSGPTARVPPVIPLVIESFG